MFILIHKDKFGGTLYLLHKGQYSLKSPLERIGLKYVQAIINDPDINNQYIFEIINKDLFTWAVLKYGIEFQHYHGYFNKQEKSFECSNTIKER